MVDRNELRSVILVSLLVAVITLVPYILAHFLAQPEGVFAGFLVNPMDGFSYLAKMRQGFEGQWLFQLPYTVDPGEGTLIFVYFLFMGHLSKWLGLPFIVLYHAMRFFGSVLMFVTAFLLIARFITNKNDRWWAFSLILIGGGLGWLVLPFGLLSSDLWIVESIPFLTAYANSHFPLATALFLSLVILMVSKTSSLGLKLVGTFLISTLLAAIQPFSMITLFAFLILWLIWETWLEAKKGGVIGDTVRERWWVYLVMIIGALPWFFYDFWITLHHPQIAAWNAQNVTPSPPVIDYIFGFGGVLFIAVFGLLKGQFKRLSSARLLAVWAVTQAILLYAPFGLQRRLSLGLYFPLVIMAVLTLGKLGKNRKKLQFAYLALLILSVPSNLVVVGSGIAGVMNLDSSVVLDHEEVDAYQWLSSNADPGEIVLSGPIAGNRIPAFADLRVFYGHPFETINAEEQKAFVERAYSSGDLGAERLLGLREQGVSYVFYGPEENKLVQTNWLESLDLSFQSGGYSIYEIPIP